MKISFKPERILLPVLLLCISLSVSASVADTVYLMEIKGEIGRPVMRKANMGIKEAIRINADYIVIDLDTYGGAVDAADSIRAAIMQCPIPTAVFISRQAASAGALISIACDSIYMRRGSSIGAATVVDASGNVMPDKYQSFMRGMMRSTAESHGKKTVTVDGKETEVWRRDPSIAAKMVDTAGVVSLTPEEAIASGYCEGMADSPEEVAEKLCGNGCTITAQKLSWTDKVALALLSPVLQSLFLMLIIGGIYFELQSPGIGLPLAAAIIGAVLYFAPLYIYGLAMHWEIALFFIGLILIAVEIFAFPGFGITGITGAALVVFSLSAAMIDNELIRRPAGGINYMAIIKPLALVTVSALAALVISIYGAARLYPKRRFSIIAQKKELRASDGWVGVPVGDISGYVGSETVAATGMFPSGKVSIGGRLYEATMEYGSAEKGDRLKITRAGEGRLYCIRL